MSSQRGRKDIWAQWMGLNPATQIAIDTDIDVETLLPNDPVHGYVMALHAIELFCPDPDLVAGAWVQASLKTVSGRVYPETPGHIATLEWHNRAGNPVDRIMLQGPNTIFTFPEPFLLPVAKVFLGCYSNITGNMNNARGRMLYKLEKVSAVEYMQAHNIWVT